MLRSFIILAQCILGCGLAVALCAPPADAHVTVLYAFKGGADGLSPSSGVIFDSLGNLYGTTNFGGGIGCGGFGCGTIYRVTPLGTETLLYAFKGNVSDGSSPTSIIRDKKGNFYGTTDGSGVQGCGAQFGCGTIFKLAPDGTETRLYAFTGGNDGANPSPGLLRDEAGYLYGTTAWGGATDNGTVFRVAPDGTEAVLHAFTNHDDGANPSPGLLRNKAGNLYGTTQWGGRRQGGIVFKLGVDGTLKSLHAFCTGRCRDGSIPEARVVVDDAGNLYGTTDQGGAYSCDNEGNGCGTVFEVMTDGTERVLHSFNPSVDGQYPRAAVIATDNGKIYGTAFQLTAPSCNGQLGVVFSLAPDGREKLRCVPSEIAGGVVERNGLLYGAATGAGSFKYAAGFVFAVKK